MDFLETRLQKIQRRKFISFSGGLENALPTYFKHLLDMNLGIIVGLTGSPDWKSGIGKSHTAVMTAMTIDKTFDASWQVIGEPQQLFDAFAKIRHLGKKHKVIVIDEGSVLANSKAHYTFLNKTIVFALQTFRNLKCMVIICMPTFHGIDKGIRQLITHYGYPEKESNEKHDVDVYLKLWKLKTDEFGDRLFRRFITMRHSETNKKITFSKFFVERLDQKTFDTYEEIGAVFKDNLRDEMQAFVKTLTKKSLTGGEDKVREIINSLKNNPEKMGKVLTKRNILSTSLLRDVYKVTQKDADVIKARIENREGENGTE